MASFDLRSLLMGAGNYYAGQQRGKQERQQYDYTRQRQEGLDAQAAEEARLRAEEQALRMRMSQAELDAFMEKQRQEKEAGGLFDQFYKGFGPTTPAPAAPQFGDSLGAGAMNTMPMPQDPGQAGANFPMPQPTGQGTQGHTRKGFMDAAMQAYATNQNPAFFAMAKQWAAMMPDDQAAAQGGQPGQPMQAGDLADPARIKWAREVLGLNVPEGVTSKTLDWMVKNSPKAPGGAGGGGSDGKTFNGLGGPNVPAADGPPPMAPPAIPGNQRPPLAPPWSGIGMGAAPLGQPSPAPYTPVPGSYVPHPDETSSSSVPPPPGWDSKTASNAMEQSLRGVSEKEWAPMMNAAIAYAKLQGDPADTPVFRFKADGKNVEFISNPDGSPSLFTAKTAEQLQSAFSNIGEKQIPGAPTPGRMVTHKIWSPYFKTGATKYTKGGRTWYEWTAQVAEGDSLPVENYFGDKPEERMAPDPYNGNKWATPEERRVSETRYNIGQDNKPPRTGGSGGGGSKDGGAKQELKDYTEAVTNEVALKEQAMEAAQDAQTYDKLNKERFYKLLEFTKKMNAGKEGDVYYNTVTLFMRDHGYKGYTAKTWDGKFTSHPVPNANLGYK